MMGALGAVGACLLWAQGAGLSGWRKKVRDEVMGAHSADACLVCGFVCGCLGGQVAGEYGAGHGCAGAPPPGQPFRIDAFYVDPCHSPTHPLVLLQAS